MPSDHGQSEMQALPMTLEDQYENLTYQPLKMQQENHLREQTMYSHDRATSSKYTRSMHFRGESEAVGNGAQNNFNY